MANYYNFAELKDKISLREVCEHYNIVLHNERNNEATASLRPEDKTPSANFNFADGTFFDYGDADLGGNIFNLVAWCEFGEKGTGRKLSNDMMTRCAAVLGERFGISPINHSKKNKEKISPQEWMPLTDNEYAAIGLHPKNMAQDMNIDVRKSTESELNRIMATRVNMPIADIARSSRTEYVAFLQASTHSIMYEAKKQYLASILALENAMKNGTQDLTPFEEKAKKLYTQLKYKCDLLEKAYPPFEERITKLNAEEYKRLVTRFRAGNPEYEIKKRLDQSVNESIDVGVVSNGELKKKAAELNQQLYLFDHGISKEDFVDFVKGYRELPDHKKFPYAAWDNKRPNSFKIKVMEKDVKVSAVLLKIDAQAITDRIEAGNTVLPYQNDRGLTAIGKQIVVAMAIHDHTQADIGKLIGEDSRRVSEAIRGKNPKVEEKLRQYYGVSNITSRSATAIKSDKVTNRHFNELTAQEQMKVIETLAASPENFSYDGKFLSFDEIRNKCIAENQKWVFDTDLKRTAAESERTIVRGDRHTVEYASLKGRETYIEFRNATADNIRLLDEMITAKFPFSSATRGNSLIVTIPRDRKEDFVRFALSNKADLSNVNNKEIQSMANNPHYQPNKATETQNKVNPKVFSL